MTADLDVPDGVTLNGRVVPRVRTPAVIVFLPIQLSECGVGSAAERAPGDVTVQSRLWLTPWIVPGSRNVQRKSCGWRRSWAVSFGSARTRVFSLVCL